MTIEQKLLSLLAQFKELGIDRQIDYDKFYLYSIITHSTAIILLNTKKYGYLRFK